MGKIKVKLYMSYLSIEDNFSYLKYFNTMLIFFLHYLSILWTFSSLLFFWNDKLEFFT